MLKIRDDIDLKELGKYGFKNFYVEHMQSLFAVKDIYVDNSKKITPDWYRIGVDEKNRKFRKTKFRPGKTLLEVKVTKNDLYDLMVDGLVEKENKNGIYKNRIRRISKNER